MNRIVNEQQNLQLPSSQKKMSVSQQSRSLQGFFRAADQFQCTNCLELHEQLIKKENYIEHQRSYHKMLTEQLQQQNEDLAEEDNINLRKLIDEYQIRGQNLQNIIEQQNKQLNEKQEIIFKLEKNNEFYEEQIKYEQMQIKNDLQQQYEQLIQEQQHMLEILQSDIRHQRMKHDKLLEKIQIEHKFIQTLTEFVIICHPNSQFQREKPSLKYIWKWLRNILEEFMRLKTNNFNTTNSIKLQLSR